MKTKTITRKCQECKKPFFAPPREINRGNGRFCSKSCGIKHSNRVRDAVFHNHICKHCGRTYTTNYKISFYCSRSCKAKDYYYRAKTHSYDGVILNRLRSLPCEICGWKESTRDVHHILSSRKGGKDIFSNLVCLCPNHHRMVHTNLISQNDLKQIAKSRTISSPK